jgi:hypothetical protein
MTESAEFELPTQEDFRCDLRALCLGAIRLTLETLLNEEIGNLVGAGGWQRMPSSRCPSTYDTQVSNKSHPSRPALLNSRSTCLMVCFCRSPRGSASPIPIACTPRRPSLNADRRPGQRLQATTVLWEAWTAAPLPRKQKDSARGAVLAIIETIAPMPAMGGIVGRRNFKEYFDYSEFPDARVELEILQGHSLRLPCGHAVRDQAKKWLKRRLAK